MKALILLLATLTSVAVAQDELVFPKGKAVTVDGRLAVGEWEDAEWALINLPDRRQVRVAYKHDAENLYVLFFELPENVFPEVLIDAQNQKTDQWTIGQFWLHASANDCEGQGEYNVYRKDGQFLCAKEKDGWEANNWPLPEKHIEIRISLAKLGLKTKHKQPIGVAFNVTNTKDMWAFMPANAKLETPRTWATAKLKW